jgi:hypothetical protein
MKGALLILVDNDTKKKEEEVQHVEIPLSIDAAGLTFIS